MTIFEYIKNLDIENFADLLSQFQNHGYSKAEIMEWLKDDGVILQKGETILNMDQFSRIMKDIIKKDMAIRYEEKIKNIV